MSDLQNSQPTDGSQVATLQPAPRARAFRPLSLSAAMRSVASRAAEVQPPMKSMSTRVYHWSDRP